MTSHIRQNLGEYLRANIVAYFFVTLIFVIGVVIGALAVKTLPEEQKTELLGYLRIFFQGLSRGTEGIQEQGLLYSVMLNNAKTIGLIWLLSFTVIGIPFVLFIIFTRGFVIGFAVGFLVNEYVVQGLLFALVSVLPHNFFAVPAVVVTGVSAVSFSLALVRRRRHSRGGSLFYQAMGHTVLCAAMLVLMLIASLTEIYISPVFMKLVVSVLVKD
ncbi:stage II sporulation protein M [Sporolituus thermophilus]|uniref:Stage II sporulation protein M n=1 Tax=Sporolituus thermophilus DSM 23256 TaxID=1123285 RepID=A0A1G7JJQ7_9FIRM|nr:stage II sporulation protein M [Sporolituus thermophilus]SDF25161.1 stage II sporulation protein M [Sporolituus thermophilus DSM 23256]